MAEVLGTAVLELSTVDAGLSRGLVAAETETKGVFGRMAASAGKMALLVGGAFAVFAGGKFLKDSITSAADFQQTLNVLQAQSHATAGEMKQVSAASIKLGADVKLPATSALDAAKAMLELSKGGLSVKQSMAAARAVILLSTAAQIDNTTSAKAVVQALSAFNLPAKDATKVVNDFAGAALASTAEMSDITYGMQQAASGAAALKVPVGDATTALAELVKAGLNGGVAGASLKIALTRLAQADGLPKVKAELAKLNITAFDSQGRFVGMAKFASEYSEATKNLTPQQKLQTAATLGGSRGMQTFLDVFGKGGKTFADLRDKVTKAGSAQQIANAQTQGFNGAMSGLKSTLETLEIQIGLKLLPVLSQFVRWLTKELPGAVATATEIIKGIGTAIGGIVDAIRPHMDQIRGAFDDVRGAAQTVFDLIRNNAGTVKELGNSAGVAAAAFLLMVTGIKTVTLAMIALDLVMDANPIMLVVLGVAALAFGLTELYQRSQTAREIMNAVWADLKAGAQAALSYITGTLIPLAIAEWQKFGPQVKAAIQGAVSAVQQGMADIKAVVTTVLDFIKGHWNDIWSVLGPIVKAALQVIKTTIQTDLNVIGDVVRAFSDVLHGRWGAAWGELKHVVSDVLSGVVSIVGSILTGLATSAFAGAKIVGREIAAGIKTAVKDLEGLAGDLIGKLGDALSAVTTYALTAARDIGEDIAAGIVSGVGSLAKDLTSKLTGALHSAVGAVKGTFGIKSPSTVLADEVGSPMAAGVIMGFVQKITELGPKASEATLKSLKGSFDAAIQHLQTTLQAQLTAAQAKIEAFKAKLTPTEALQAALQAQAALASVKSSYAQAEALLTGLKAKQDQTWADLLASQAKNMAALVAQQNAAMAEMKTQQQGTQMDADIAKHEFDKGATANASDPLAVQLVNADKYLRMIKQNYAQGNVSLDDLLRAQDSFDAATLAAADDSNAQKLDADYQNWQALGLQATQGAAAILTQQAADDAAILAQQGSDQQDQKTLLGTFQQEKLDAETNFGKAKQDLLDFYIGQEAKNERTHTDTMATELNSTLTTRYGRIKTHLDNVHNLTDTELGKLETMAGKSGKTITDNLANAIGDAADPNGKLATNLKAVAALIAKYLKTNSPSELGPLSTLDTWWRGFAPALVKGFDHNLVARFLASTVNPKLNTGMLMAHYATDATAGAGLTGAGVALTQHFHETPADADPVAIGAVTSFALKNLRT